MYLAQSTNWGHFPDRIGILSRNMGFDSEKIIFISKKLELLTLKKSLIFSDRFSPFISDRISLTTRRLRELYRQHSLGTRRVLVTVCSTQRTLAT